MKDTNHNSPTQYFSTLLDDSNEFNKLVDILTNNETYFFRERSHFEICVDQLVPELLNKITIGGQKIKIVSAGCSTGEEPYSVAMALEDKFGPGIFDIVSIEGIDISRKAILAAREGIFNSYSFREKTSSYRQKYFNPISGNKHELKPDIKNRVTFSALNLSQGDFPPLLNNIDIIFYRNVSIYFEADTKKMIFNKLSEQLNENGYIIMSSTETFFHNIGNLYQKEIAGQFLYQKKSGRQDDTPSFILSEHKFIKDESTAEISIPEMREVPVDPPESNPADRKPDVIPEENSLSLFEESLNYAKEKNYDLAIVGLNKLISDNPENLLALALKAGILINLQQLREAKEICGYVLELDEWNLECHLLSGIIAKMENDLEETMLRFKSASYIQPACWLAHMYLGEVYESSQELKVAFREYGLALKHLEKSGIHSHGLSYFPLAYGQDELIHLLEHNLIRLGEERKGT